MYNTESSLQPRARSHSSILANLVESRWNSYQQVMDATYSAQFSELDSADGTITGLTGCLCCLSAIITVDFVTVNTPVDHSNEIQRGSVESVRVCLFVIAHSLCLSWNRRCCRHHYLLLHRLQQLAWIAQLEPTSASNCQIPRDLSTRCHCGRLYEHDCAPTAILTSEPWRPAIMAGILQHVGGNRKSPTCFE